MVICLAPVSRDLSLLAAFELALPDRVCGVWLAGAQTPAPIPLRLAAPGGWRTLLIGPDLGQLLSLVDVALVDAGKGPVRLTADELRDARVLELTETGTPRLVPLEQRSPEATLSDQSVALRRTRIRYLG